jgi:hypothetical protein
MYLARNLSHFLTNDEIDRIGAEWRVYQLAEIPNELTENNNDCSNNIIKHISIDKYWHRIFSTTTSTGAPQYLVLSKLVKCLLSLSHGNSDVERGFSENKHIVSDERSSLSEMSINGLRATNGGVKFFGDGKTHMVSVWFICSKYSDSIFKVPTTSTMISNVQEAYSRYAKYNEQQQKASEKNVVVNGKRAADVEGERLQEKENQLINEQKKLQDELNQATKMLEEGTFRLSAALNNGKLNDIGTAEVLVTAANSKLTVLKSQMIENSENLNRLRKKQKI